MSGCWQGGEFHVMTSLEKETEMKLKKSITCNTEGAVFVSWDTYTAMPVWWNAKLGIGKYRGCVAFYPKNQKNDCSFDHHIIPERCIKKYGDCPAREEAWLVQPDPKDPDNFWEWERVDTKLELSP